MSTLTNHSSGTHAPDLHPPFITTYSDLLPVLTQTTPHSRPEVPFFITNRHFIQRATGHHQQHTHPRGTPYPICYFLGGWHGGYIPPYAAPYYFTTAHISLIQFYRHDKYFALARLVIPATPTPAVSADGSQQRGDDTLAFTSIYPSALSAHASADTPVGTRVPLPKIAIPRPSSM